MTNWTEEDTLVPESARLYLRYWPPLAWIDCMTSYRLYAPTVGGSKMDYARIDCATSNGLFIAACKFCRGHGAQYQCYSYMDCCYSARNQCKRKRAADSLWLCMHFNKLTRVVSCIIGNVMQNPSLHDYFSQFRVISTLCDSLNVFR